MGRDIETHTQGADESIRDIHAPVLKNTVSDHGNSWLAGIALLVAGAALAFCYVAQRENRLVVLEIQGLKNAMHAHGIRDTNPHLPGEHQ